MGSGGRRRPGAGDGDRTHVASLEGWSSTIELHPLCAAATEADLVVSTRPIFTRPSRPHRSAAPDPCARPGSCREPEALVEGVGFEPTKTYVGRFTVCCL